MAQNISSLNLAFIGDAVYELFVREHELRGFNGDVNTLNKKTTKLSKAVTQSEIVDIVLPILSDDEEAVYKRGRNAKSASVPKSCTPAQYRKATGLESLIGHLYLNGQLDRVKEILEYGIKQYQKDK